MKHSKNLLLIFTRNPELGKGKRRLAATVGDQIALDIYRFLLAHTVAITKDLPFAKWVYYSERIGSDNLWKPAYYTKKLQQGEDLGRRMANAFAEGFLAGYERICIIGSDMYDLSEREVASAFDHLDQNDYVVGPAADGGYYLLGMKKATPTLFKHKDWGQATVLEDTLSELEKDKVHLLAVKNDVDTYEDIKDVTAFIPFLKDIAK